MIDGKIVLVTGGSGSFGNEFIQHILAHHKPRKVIVYSRDEFKQSEMADRIQDDRIRFFIGDVRDLPRLKMAMREVDLVVHAAAMKQVTIAEYNPMECVKTNIMGAENVVAAAIACGVQKVVALSTDKACNPVNLYGATKLASDKIFVASNNLSGSVGTRFAVVRYGNVVGSRGSVVPLFERLLKSGADHLPITDDRMTRFWITLDQGVRFVVSSFETMQGGELFVPKIPSMRVVDLAAAMAPGVPLKVIGIRPGEKLHEVMITEDDARMTVELPDRYVIQPALNWWRAERNVTVAVSVSPEFRYGSDNNTEWLNAEQVRVMLAEVKH
jgi:UDP-N-acetylglucosamine 4,6-dehydratase/5-epimerase